MRRDCGGSFFGIMEGFIKSRFSTCRALAFWYTTGPSFEKHRSTVFAYRLAYGDTVPDTLNLNRQLSLGSSVICLLLIAGILDPWGFPYFN